VFEMSDDEPELRDGPPWVMEEMIEAELELPAQIAGSAAVALVASRVTGAVAAGSPVVVCGCGTSEHAARAICAILSERGPAASVAARDSFEVQLDPPTSGLLLAISHGGGTAATLAAVSGAVARGASAVLITACPDNTPDGVEAAATPLYDKSWCHTVAYSSAMLTCALGAGLDAPRARQLVANEMAAREQRRLDARAVADCERLLIIGSGVDEVTASELALKVEEAAHVPCTPLGTEKVLHGHLPAADSRTGVVLLGFDPTHAAARAARAFTVAEAVAVLSMPTVNVATPGLGSSAEALLAGAVALQLLTLELTMALGTNPDLIRREQPLYRKVAEIGKAG
jgi:glutamine---fructose-6-phosphate transaminase (isomerizing)